MNKTYQLIMTAAKGEAKTLEANPGASKTTVILQAEPGARYQLTDTRTGFAPDNIRVSRSGKNLKIFVDAVSEPAFVIENFYEHPVDDRLVLTGKAEDGSAYAYTPETASVSATVAQLKDDGMIAGMALGGEGIAAGAAVGLLAPVAVFNPLLLAAGAAGIAAAAGGGGGGKGDATGSTAPAITIASINEDSGVKNNDFVTNDNTLVIRGTVQNYSATDKVLVQILDGTTVISEGNATIGSDGQWFLDNTTKLDANKNAVTNALASGTYTIKATLINASASMLAASSQALTVDNSGPNNSDGTPDPNHGLTVAISAITEDTGYSASDFHTADSTLTYSGKVQGFQSNGDLVRLVLKSSDGAVLAKQYVTPDANNNWAWADPVKRSDGNYSLDAIVVDVAGNEVTAMTSQLVKIDSSTSNQSDGTSDPNSNATSVVTVDGITEDTGYSPKDFYTADNTPAYYGQVKNYSPNGDLVRLVLTDSAGTKVTTHVTPDANGHWTLQDSIRPDGNYTLEATLVDPAGNPVRPAFTQAIQIDTSIDNNAGRSDGNGSASLNIATLVVNSTGQRSGWADFYNNNPDQSHFKGTLSSWVDNGDKLHLEVFAPDGSRVSAEYVDVKDKAWSSGTALKDLSDGKYILRATVEDLAGNTVLVDTQSFYIDTKAPEALSLLNPGFGLNEGAKVTITGASGNTTSYGPYDFEGTRINTSLNPDTTVNYTIVDYAGNSMTGGTGTSPYKGSLLFDKSDANANILPAQEVIKTTGDLPFKVVNSPTSLDLTAVIQDNIPKVFNALDLNDGKATNVVVSLKNLLDIGMTNCFTLEGRYENDIQFKIKGDSSDSITLGKVFTSQNSQINLDGVSYNVYYAKSGNIDIDLFIQTSITQIQ